MFKPENEETNYTKETLELMEAEAEVRKWLEEEIQFDYPKLERLNALIEQSEIDELAKQEREKNKDGDVWEARLTTLNDLEANDSWDPHRKRLKIMKEQWKINTPYSDAAMLSYLRSFKEAVIINSLIIYCQEIDALLDKGKSLREISQWSYQQRESGRNVPFMAKYFKSDDFVYVANTNKSQRDLRQFFDQSNGIFNRFSLYITSDRKIIFRQIAGEKFDANELDLRILYPLENSQKEEIISSNTLKYRTKAELTNAVIENVKLTKGYNTLENLLSELPVERLINFLSEKERNQFYKNEGRYFMI